MLINELRLPDGSFVMWKFADDTTVSEIVVKFLRILVGNITIRKMVDPQGASIKPGTWNIPEHPGTSNNYDNYEKKCVKLNFGLAHVTIWSAQVVK